MRALVRRLVCRLRGHSWARWLSFHNKTLVDDLTGAVEFRPFRRRRCWRCDFVEEMEVRP